MNRDKWLGVGGKFESGESPEECILREAKEETGLTLTRWAYRGIVTFVSGDYCEYMHLFTADAFEGDAARVRRRRAGMGGDGQADGRRSGQATRFFCAC